jgi:hypothetical protein
MTEWNQDRRSVLASLVALVLMAVAITPAIAQGNNNPGIIPINQQYTKLAVAWSQWNTSFPVSDLPALDLTGAKGCLGDQGPGNVFFLASVFGAPDSSATVTRNITVPAGSRLLVPVLGTVWDNVGADPPFTVPQLYEQAAATIALVTELHASIDGRSVQDLFSYRVKSDPFCYTIPATDNIYQFFGLPGELLSPFACAQGFCICPAV